MDAEHYLRMVAAGGTASELGLRKLFDLYAGRIKGFFRRHGYSDEDAADLLQETFIRVVRAASSFRFDSKVSTWIWAIAHNCLNDRWRTRKEVDSLDEMKEKGGDAWECSQGSSEPEHELLEMRNCVRMAFLEFAERYPQNAHALQLSAVEGWSMDELAESLGRTVSATREFVSQCRKKLRPYLERCRELLPA